MTSAYVDTVRLGLIQHSVAGFFALVRVVQRRSEGCRQDWQLCHLPKRQQKVINDSDILLRPRTCKLLRGPTVHVSTGSDEEGVMSWLFPVDSLCLYFDQQSQLRTILKEGISNWKISLMLNGIGTRNFLVRTPSHQEPMQLFCWHGNIDINYDRTTSSEQLTLIFNPSADSCEVSNAFEHATVYDSELSCGVLAKQKVKVLTTAETGLPVIDRFICGPDCKDRDNCQ